GESASRVDTGPLRAVSGAGNLGRARQRGSGVSGKLAEIRPRTGEGRRGRDRASGEWEIAEPDECSVWHFPGGPGEDGAGRGEDQGGGGREAGRQGDCRPGQAC